ncbi:MAG: winged helix-turn-helix domain-containing protein [Pseudomonadota bacterium]
MGGVLLGVDRPPLAKALAARGVALWRGGTPDAVIAPLEGWLAMARGAPAFVLTGDEAEAVAAIDAGADDATPYATTDALIAARLASWLQRRSGLLTVGPLTIDLVRRSATRDGRDLALLPREFALLAFLATRGGTVVGQADLLNHVWGLRFDPGTNVVQVHVARLRARLDRGFDWPMLLTERGLGYRLVAAPRDPR